MNSYKDLALYDMKSAKTNYKFELWNKVGRECQQSCEKYLKSIICRKNTFWRHRWSVLTA